MYLTSLTTENVKLLADQTFSFTNPDGTPRLWTVVIGDNGLCKTTLLQLIALAASGEKLARKLVEEPSDYRNAGAPHGVARVCASFAVARGTVPGEPDREKLELSLSAEPGRADMRGAGAVAAIDEIRSRKAQGFFCVGYGVGRYLPRPGEVAIPRDALFDRVEGLFRQDHKMLGIDFYEALKKLGEAEGGERGTGNELALAYSRTLRDVLLAEDELGERLLPWLSRIDLGGKGGVERMSRLLEARRFELEVGAARIKLGPGSLSQGYQSMIAWICDLLGQAFLERGASVDPKTLEGVALLDELDLHLHPTWQRRIVPILKRAFPRLQFVVTTHSPLVLTGFEQHEIVALTMSDGRVVQRAAALPPGGLTGSELLGGFFDVPRAARPAFVEKERRYLELAARDTRSAAEEAALAQLAAELAPYWPSGPLEAA